MNEPNQRVLEAEKTAKEQEIAKLEQTIAQMDIRIAALSETAEQKRTQAREAFRDKHKGRFADIDVAKALSGMPVTHKMTLAGLTYSLRIPNGDHQREIQLFVQDPVVKTEGDKTLDVGPISPSERQVLPWISGVATGADKARDLAGQPIAARLKLLRTLPALTVDALARECENLETYLSVTMELELGNSSPTP